MKRWGARILGEAWRMYLGSSFVAFRMGDSKQYCCQGVPSCPASWVMHFVYYGKRLCKKWQSCRGLTESARDACKECDSNLLAPISTSTLTVCLAGSLFVMDIWLLRSHRNELPNLITPPHFLCYLISWHGFYFLQAPFMHRYKIKVRFDRN